MKNTRPFHHRIVGHGARMQILLIVVLLNFCHVVPAAGQAFEQLGTRALGMGGAFVAVADDASAAYWNPAGLANGPTFNLLVEGGSGDAIPDPDAPIDRIETAVESRSARMFSLAVPALALTYYRLRETAIRHGNGATAGSDPGRQDLRLRAASAESLITHQFGVTLAQTIVNGLVVGSTVKLVRGVGARGAPQARQPAADAIEAAEKLIGRAGYALDIDVGVMAAVGTTRVGFVVANVREPRFRVAGSEDGRIRLDRRARVGAAWTPGRPGAVPYAPVTVAVDLDVTRASTAAGEQRNVAAGAEGWLANRRVGVRAGVRVNTLETAMRAIAFGASAAVRAGTYLDGQVTRGRSDATSWSIGVRVTF